MRKNKNFPNVVFSAEVLKASVDKLVEISSGDEQDLDLRDLIVQHDDATWDHDSLSEFFADYSKYSMQNYYELSVSKNGIRLRL